MAGSTATTTANSPVAPHGAGNDRVMAAAKHILRSLSSSQTDDVLRILSSFDDRLSNLNNQNSQVNSVTDQVSSTPDSSFSSSRNPSCGISDDPNNDRDGNGNDNDDDNGESSVSSADKNSCLPSHVVSAEEIIMRWFSDASNKKISLWFDKPEDVKEYLNAVDTLYKFCTSSPPKHHFDHVQNVLQTAMLRLETEFSRILKHYGGGAQYISNVVNSSKSSFSASQCGSSRSSTRNEEHQDNVAMESHYLVKDEKHNGGGNGDAGNGHSSEEDEEGVAKSKDIDGIDSDILPPNVVSELYDISMRMLRSDHQAECLEVYVRNRKASLEEGLHSLGQGKLNFEEIQKMSWEQLEIEIGSWVHAMKTALSVIFPSEKQLADRIFPDSPEIAASCFTDIAKPSLMKLLSFAEAVAIGRRAPEKIFRTLDMYECLKSSLPSMESLFGEASSKVITSEASAILSRIGNAVRGNFDEFECAVQSETSKTPVPGGALHPLVRYVMNYMKFLSDYTDTMNQLLWDRKDIQIGNVDENLPEQSALSSVTLSLMENLEKILDAKSKLYRDPALSCLFLMNNVRYICQKVKCSEVRKLVGDDWIKRNNGKLRQYHNTYRRTSWTRVLACLRDDGINISGGVANSAARNAIKEKFKSFNCALEENVKTQCSWIVSDPQLCIELRISITEMLLPAYRSFLGRFQSHLDGMRHRERYLKYTAEDLELYLNNLFQGSTVSMARKK